jgi:hypothetical protein
MKWYAQLVLTSLLHAQMPHRLAIPSMAPSISPLIPVSPTSLSLPLIPIPLHPLWISHVPPLSLVEVCVRYLSEILSCNAV